MNAALLDGQNLFGLFEINASGTVLYSRAEPDGSANKFKMDVTGRNFFEETAPFENTAEFRYRIGNFTRSYHQAENFHFTCQFGNEVLPVKVLLARIREQSNGDHTESILVHIREA